MPYLNIITLKKAKQNNVCARISLIMKSKEIKNFLLELFFPSFCFLCKEEGSYLCEDCKELLDISQKNKNLYIEGINKVHYALTPENRYSKRIIDNYIGENPIKGFSKVFVDILQDHFSLSGRIPFSKDYLVITIIEDDKNNNFNRKEELAKQFSKRFNLKYQKNLDLEKLKNRNVILIIDKLKDREDITNFVKKIETNKIILICVSL